MFPRRIWIDQKYITAALFFLWTVISVSAQQVQPQKRILQGANKNIAVSGFVKDEAGQPMEAVVIKILAVKDTSMVAGGTTGATGRFRISKIKPGNYKVVFSFLGYKNSTRFLNVSVQDSLLLISPVTMVPTSIQLKEAVVVGKVPDVVTKEDTVEYNADSFKTQPNAVIEDLLKKLPGLEVDKNGKIKAQGKEVKKILLDGKEFFSDDPKIASKNLPANIINKLQVIDRKSDEARFSGVDDGETETIINLTVKPGMKKGWFGNAQAGAGTKDRYEVSGMMNRLVDDTQFSFLGGSNNTGNMGSGDMGSSFSGSSGGGGNGTTTSATVGTNFNLGKSEKLRYGGNIQYGYSNSNAWQKSSRQNLLKDSISYDNSEQNYNTKGHNIMMNFRLHWEVDTLTILEFMPSFGYNKSKTVNENRTATLGGHPGEEESLRDSINWGKMYSASDGHGYNLAGRISMSRRFKAKTGRQMTFSFNYRANNNKEDGISENTNYFFHNNDTKYINQKDDNRNWGGSFGIRASYVEPIFKNHFLTFAYNYNYNYSNADKLAYNINPGSESPENVPAGYFVDDYQMFLTQSERLNSSEELQLDSLYSNRFRNVFQSHKISIGLNAKINKLRYNVGFDMNPSRSESENLMNHERDVPGRTVFNYSPMLNLNYNFNKQKNLSFKYMGNTRQPSINQLQPVQNITNPLRITAGNPDLNPSYTNNFNMRYSLSNMEKLRSMMTSLSGSFTLNSIVTQTTYDNNTGIQTTKPVNVNGVWNINGMALYSMSLRNKKFRFSNTINASYSNNIGFINAGAKESERNISRSLNVSENAGLNYNSDLFDIGVNGTYSYALTGNSVQSREGQQTMNFGGSLNGTVYIPGSIIIGTDLGYSGSSGYSSGYDRNQWRWNAQASWQFLKGKQATLMFKIYDILKQVSNISRTVTGNYIQDLEYNTLSNYCMISFSYRFNRMGKKSQSDDLRPERAPWMMRQDRRPPGDRPGERLRGGGYGGGGMRIF